MQLVAVLLFVSLVGLLVADCSRIMNRASEIAGSGDQGEAVQQPLQRIPESELPVGEDRR